ncbi:MULTISPECIES: MFS transporter [unclassified Streptosporangium]|uniref:MFS transporter n=1 Tax=unclassified Streptosporangium TaxID=2632669 RepID=UPI002E2A3E5F|nr:MULTISPECIES: MFS transporter [unclassified Streptosporangium]
MTGSSPGAQVSNPQSKGLMLALIAATQFTVAADYNIVYVALPDMGRALGFTAQSLQWVVSSYAIALGGFLLLGGRLVDRLGARRMLILGLAVFGLACLAGGFAGGPAPLIAARAVQGIGAALLAPATLTLINTRFAEGRERNHALAVWGAVGSAGLAAGALLGGVLTDAWGWQWVLFVLAVPALLAVAAAPVVLDPDRPGNDWAGVWGRIDVPGAVLATVGSSLLVLGLVNGPDSGWGSLQGAGSITAGVLILGAFLLVEGRTRDPLMPPGLLRNRNLVMSVLVILIFQSALGGCYYLYTTYLQGVLHYDALAAGLAFLPLAVCSMVAALWLARVLGRLGLRVTLVTGMTVNGIGIVLTAAAVGTGTPFWALLPGLVLWGIGGGMTFPAMFASAATGVEPDKAGIASGVASAFQQIGGAAGLAILVAIATWAGLGDSAGTDSAADGIQTAMWIGGAASVGGGLLALALHRPGAPTRPQTAEAGRQLGRRTRTQ